jgi:peptide subunit release factor 1 (eRF1)
MEEFLKYIEKQTTSNTTLITLYIKPTSNLWLYNKFLTKELSSCANIKDKNTRKEVEINLKSIVNNIKNIPNKNYDKGLLILSGYNTSYV